jgi:hypothetical protein
LGLDILPSCDWFNANNNDDNNIAIGTLGSYLRGASQGGSADAVACLPVACSSGFGFFPLFFFFLVSGAFKIFLSVIVEVFAKLSSS